MIKEIKIYRVDHENTVLDSDYEKYTIQIMRLFMNYMTEK